MSGLLARLTDVQQTAFGKVTTIGLYYYVITVWAVATLLEKPVEVVAFGMVLGFLAALGGFSFAQYSKMRDSDYGALDRQAVIERAKVPLPSVVPSPVTAEAGSVVQVAAQPAAMPILPAPVEPGPGVETRADGAAVITAHDGPVG